MAKKEFAFRGKTIEEVKSLTLKEFMELIPSRARRSLERGFTEEQKKLLAKVKSGDKDIKTQFKRCKVQKTQCAIYVYSIAHKMAINICGASVGCYCFSNGIQ